MIRAMPPLLHFGKVALYLVANDKSPAFSVPPLLRGERLCATARCLYLSGTLKHYRTGFPHGQEEYCMSTPQTLEFVWGDKVLV